ncbi:hypothetical protein EV138_1196 [Kribbella voronezhensis]|uniref:Uncharacterized protein n=1 Tax=Kribbella voronezhensis TaxID=2512212 RepID=A0A4R7T7R0_9ACTN|nr:hypothetical protein [Kribbella voronezhensis]TDU87669.1 hypothetical protein EV138_1196 [Kribbella voronezhensis]
MNRREAQGWRGVAGGGVVIVVGVALIAKDVPVFGVSALPVVGAGISMLTVGLYRLFIARRGRGR